jgi:Domain of unknown function (DUF4157)
MAYALVSRSRGSRPVPLKAVRRGGPGRHGGVAGNARGASDLAHPRAAALAPMPVLQTKLEVGAPNDRFEQEAERVADQVMRMPANVTLGAESAPAEGARGSIQRMCDDCAKEETARLQRMPRPAARISAPSASMMARSALPDRAGGRQRQNIDGDETREAQAATGAAPDIMPGVEARTHALRGPGRPLSPDQRAFFEPRFGHHFGEVRIHTDTGAADSARALNARAYTIGTDIAFASGRFAAGTRAGRRLLAHELTHVAQNDSVPVVRRQVTPEGERFALEEARQEFVIARAVQEDLENRQREILGAGAPIGQEDLLGDVTEESVATYARQKSGLADVQEDLDNLNRWVRAVKRLSEIDGELAELDRRLAIEDETAGVSPASLGTYLASVDHLNQELQALRIELGNLEMWQRDVLQRAALERELGRVDAQLEAEDAQGGLTPETLEYYFAYRQRIENRIAELCPVLAEGTLSEVSWGESASMYPTKDMAPTDEDLYHPENWDQAKKCELLKARGAMDLISQRNPDVQRGTPNPKDAIHQRVKQYHFIENFPSFDPEVSDPEVKWFFHDPSPTAVHTGIDRETQVRVKTYGPFYNSYAGSVPKGPVHILFYKQKSP